MRGKRVKFSTFVKASNSALLGVENWIFPRIPSVGRKVPAFFKIESQTLQKLGLF